MFVSYEVVLQLHEIRIPKFLFNRSNIFALPTHSICRLICMYKIIFIFYPLKKLKLDSKMDSRYNLSNIEPSNNINTSIQTTNMTCTSVPNFVYALLQKQQMRHEKMKLQKVIKRKERSMQATESPIVRNRIEKEIVKVYSKIDRIDDRINLHK